MRSSALAQRAQVYHQKQRRLASVVSRGRRIGKPHGSYIADLVSLRKWITLCQKCAHKFDARANRYFPEVNIPANVICDACGDMELQGHLFVPPEYIEGKNVTWQPRNAWQPYRQR